MKLAEIYFRLQKVQCEHGKADVTVVGYCIIFGSSSKGNSSRVCLDHSPGVSMSCSVSVLHVSEQQTDQNHIHFGVCSCYS